LFSTGYQNGVAGAVNTILKRLYPNEYTKQHSQVFSSMVFAGTVIGMLTFGYGVDKVGRKAGMMVAALIITVFAALSAGAYSGGSITGMLNALVSRN
jgi:MFS family permease